MNYWPSWGTMENTELAFLKCTRWQVEETLDKLSCPFHYYCDSIYPGDDYPPAVDFAVLIFTAATYMSTLLLMLADMSSSSSRGRGRKSILILILPSGPIFLPVFLLILAKGNRINTVFPLFLVGPSILHLVYISALTFDINNNNNNIVKYVILESSTMSGILHASLNLEGVILPYYTGLDALTRSNLSGECPSCVCRNEALVVGGRGRFILSCRSWSFVVVCAALCARIVCRLSAPVIRKAVVLTIRWLLEALVLVLITLDCVSLVLGLSERRRKLQSVVCGCVFCLVFVHLLKLVRRCNFMMSYDQLEKGGKFNVV